MSKSEQLVRINIRITQEIKDWMEEYSEATGLSQSNVGLLALETYMIQKKSFEQLKQLSNLQVQEIIKRELESEKN